jgi:nicotinamidase-related amidase
MWDKHWCKGATGRVDALAHRMSPLLKLARARGVQIVHAPSDVMDFYKDYPQRRLMQSLPKVQPPQALDLSDPPLPIDDSDRGCDTPGDKEHQAWSRQHPAIDIEPQDVISDNGNEVYSFLRERGIQYLFIMGVHANMCVLGRSFAIRQMTRWGIHCILIRDLTDAMYNPAMKPYVSHEQGTQLVIEHIEKYWCPSILSTDLQTALKP